MQIPKLCRQKTKYSDLAFVRLNGQKHYLGVYGTPESDENYHRMIAEWLVSKRTSATSKTEVTINHLVISFLEHAETYYMKNGRTTDTYSHFVQVSSRLTKLYGSLPVDKFTPVSLKTLRQLLIDGRQDKKTNPLQKSQPLSRRYVNQCIDRIRQIFQWGVASDLVKPETHYALCQLANLKRGRSKAKELPKVKPVPDDVVEKTLPFLPSPVAAMVRLQRLTGMRPGEVRSMRLCDIDTSDTEWLYIPYEHKTEHHDDCPRLIVLGGRSQSILTPYLMDCQDTPEKWLFSPKESVTERKVNLREKRKTKVQPSQIDRRKPHPKRKAKDQYTKESYRRCIARAAQKAGVKHWFPNQLRHTALTAIRAMEGIEAAQVMASHKNIAVTEIYAEKDIAKARELARKYG